MACVAVLNRLKARLLPPAASLLLLGTEGAMLERCLYVAARLRLSDRLRDGPVHIDALARDSGANPDALYRIMRALTYGGVFEESPGKTFRTTRLGRALESDTRDSMLGWIEYVGAPWYREQWNALTASVMNGRDVYRNLYGIGCFEWLQRNATSQHGFDQGIADLSTLSNRTIAAALPLDDGASLVDVGGGKGSQLAAILASHPGLQGVLFELPNVLARARQELKACDAGVIARIEFVDGTFFDSIPFGRDVYLMKSVVHDWDDAHALDILRNCGRAMRANARLLLVEMLLAGDHKAHLVNLLDIGMLALTGGRERTLDEYTALLQSAGMKVTRVLPTGSPYSVIEAIKG